MGIQIDREIFQDRVSKKFGSRQYGSNAVSFSDEVYDAAQDWFDLEKWKTDPELDTQKECRIELSKYIKEKVPPRDEEKAWFVPSFIWVWLAQQVVVFIVRLIIEYYWDDIFQEIESEK
tara:strand:- start:394 stop:750 length:357 start_codon:yes stop_codon:yes gene_type:complete